MVQSFVLHVWNKKIVKKNCVEYHMNDKQRTNNIKSNQSFPINSNDKILRIKQP